MMMTRRYVPGINLDSWRQEARATVASHGPNEQTGHCAVDHELRAVDKRLQLGRVDKHQRSEDEDVNDETNELLCRDGSAFGERVFQTLEAGKDGGQDDIGCKTSPVGLKPETEHLLINTGNLRISTWRTRTRQC